LLSGHRKSVRKRKRQIGKNKTVKLLSEKLTTSGLAKEIAVATPGMAQAVEDMMIAMAAGTKETVGVGEAGIEDNLLLPHLLLLVASRTGFQLDQELNGNVQVPVHQAPLRILCLPRPHLEVRLLPQGRT